MTEGPTIARLRQHAGLDPSDGRTISAVTTGPVDGQELTNAVSDFIDALAALNNELNGPEPSAAASRKAGVVSREAAYAVAEAARMLRDAGANRQAWEVDTGWLAVLAGDIDDVRKHVAEEAIASLPE